MFGLDLSNVRLLTVPSGRPICNRRFQSADRLLIFFHCLVETTPNHGLCCLYETIVVSRAVLSAD